MNLLSNIRFILLFLLPISVKSQNIWHSWTQIQGSVYNDDVITSLTVDNTNNIIVAGNDASASRVLDFQTSNNRFLAKFDTAFNVIWGIPAQAYGLGAGTAGGKVCTDKSGNIYWAATFGDSVFIDKKKLVGFNSTFSQSERSFFITKISPTGQIIWNNVFTCTSSSAIASDVTPTIASLSIDANDNLYIAGTYTDSLKNISSSIKGFGTGTGYIIKLNASTGILKKMLSVGNSGLCRIAKIKVDSKGNPVIAGDFIGSITLNGETISGGYDIFIAKLDSNFNKKWIKTASDGGVADIRAMDIDEKDEIYVSGSFSGWITLSPSVSATPNYNSLFIAHYDVNGTPKQLKIGDEDTYTIYPRDLISYKGRVVTTGEFRGNLKMGATNIISTNCIENSIFTLTLDSVLNLKKLNTVISCGLTRGTALSYLPTTGQMILAYTFTRFVGVNGFNINTNGKDAIIAIDKDIVSASQDISTAINAKIYPNPSSNLVNIESTNLYTIKIFNTTGQLLITSNTNTIIPINHLPNGLYNISIEDEKGNKSYHKLIVAH